MWEKSLEDPISRGVTNAPHSLTQLEAIGRHYIMVEKISMQNEL